MKAPNIFLIVIGLALLGYGHIHWLVRHEDPQVKTSTHILLIVPGWALLTMGYIGLQCQARGNGKDEP